jgi:hypothetical protein
VNERALLHPVTLVALATLVLNDHVLKWTWRGWVTGKLSDVAGLVLAPIVLAAVLRARRREHVLACAVVTAVAFAAIKVDPRATVLWCDLLAWGRWVLVSPVQLAWHGELPAWIGVDGVTDPTDLVTLPASLAVLRVARPDGTVPALAAARTGG